MGEKPAMNSDLQKCRKHYEGLSPHIKCRKTAQCLLSAIQIAERLEQSSNDVLDAFDAGAFVRNTDGDGSPDWAVKALPHLRSLGALNAAVSRPEKSNTP